MTDALKARLLLSSYLEPTPLSRYPALSASSGADLVVKHEDLQLTGAFKVRGGLALVAGMNLEEKGRGLIAYSTGNHAQSLAYASAKFGVPCTIVMPQGANPAKAEAVRSLGAELVLSGANFEGARQHAEHLATQRGLRVVSAANEPGIIAGVATLYLEIFTAEPDLEALVVPVGSGTGAAAACLVAHALAPGCEVIAVQSSASPAAHDSWREGRPVNRANLTVVDGLATGSGFELTQGIMRRHLKDFLLVDDDQIAAAQLTMLRQAGTMAEGAGAAALAGVLAHPGRFAGRRVGIVCSGGNLNDEERRALTAAG
jgi:threonine dehydratase